MVQEKECNVMNVTRVEYLAKVCQITNNKNISMFPQLLLLLLLLLLYPLPTLRPVFKIS